MATVDFGARKERSGIDIDLFNPNRARIRSNWPVTSPRGNTSAITESLRDALENGIEAKCDTHRAGFFEADTGHAWFYFHIAPKLGRIYLVAALMDDKRG